MGDRHFVHQNTRASTCGRWCRIFFGGHLNRLVFDVNTFNTCKKQVKQNRKARKTDESYLVVWRPALAQHGILLLLIEHGEGEIAETHGNTLSNTDSKPLSDRRGYNGRHLHQKQDNKIRIRPNFSHVVACELNGKWRSDIPVVVALSQWWWNKSSVP